ncbi:NADP-dependent malic enzyme [Thioalkalivibrio nitratireducens DSM 14787]|uniref:NADP-dependent malic enzyme n=1 Tax=Thioalkalivibrio nitratireducens (strain DSM 14787 / UNIQEM 213 / ALEN2) TaxID=1255043 RepID=L0DUC4_THIND|nr:malic enzyme-like NAD(P)-binding protein [Thioalkalivibrio nitratireducens]AGA31936.1 NADP-dependent malic enzyme [Thioalkalivibrio nitratireducens DSM 14787]
MSKNFKQRALEYHERAPAGKLAIHVTKPTATQDDLSLAYSPGVAAPVRAIVEDPDAAYRYTGKSNLVAVITDGTAVLGLGNVGPLASKPVMEGKAVLFKRFANIDVYDIEVNAPHPEEFINTVARIASGFGGINLEDIAAPHCFEIEKRLSERLDIPVFHDDQHGTAIITAAGLLNALEIQGKKLEDARIVCVGAGAAGIASMRLLLRLGAHRTQIFMVDRKGVIHDQRTDLNEFKQLFAQETELRTLEDACAGADVFIGLSGPDILTQEMLRSMAPRPIVFALSNPDPEIMPELAHATRHDLVMATGRSDFPNQVNNVLGFPFIFRGALDVRARHITDEMHVAAVHALAGLAREPVPQDVLDAYGTQQLEFGPEYILPTPFDPRLIDTIPAAVAQAARDSGVARV